MKNPIFLFVVTMLMSSLVVSLAQAGSCTREQALERHIQFLERNQFNPLKDFIPAVDSDKRALPVFYSLIRQVSGGPYFISGQEARKAAPYLFKELLPRMKQVGGYSYDRYSIVMTPVSSRRIRGVSFLVITCSGNFQIYHEDTSPGDIAPW